MLSVYFVRLCERARGGVGMHISLFGWDVCVHTTSLHMDGALCN